MALTDEQERLLRRMFPDGPKRSGGQTPEQGENLSIRAARYGFRFEGLDEPMPSEDEIREALRRPGGEARFEAGRNEAPNRR
jgi:hypothetical protein